MKKYFIGGLICLLLIIFGIFIGSKIIGKKSIKQINSQILLTALQDKGFLVTKTIIADVSTKLKTEEESFLKNIFWGQEIKADAVVEINLGIDLKKLTAKDIKVFRENIEISLPLAEIFNTRLVGNINVENKQGIFKRFLENDDGYNQAMEILLKQAEETLVTDEIIEAVNNQANEEIRQLIEYLNPESKIKIIFN